MHLVLHLLLTSPTTACPGSADVPVGWVNRWVNRWVDRLAKADEDVGAPRGCRITTPPRQAVCAFGLPIVMKLLKL